MKSKKLTFTSLLLVASLVGCTEGHKISKDEASKIITDIVNVVSDSSFSTDIDVISIHYTEKTKSTIDDNGILTKYSSVDEIFIDIDKDNDFYTLKRIYSSEDVTTSSEGEEYKSKDTSMMQTWYFVDNGVHFYAYEEVSSSSTDRTYSVLDKESFNSFAKLMEVAANSHRFKMDRYYEIDSLINDTENYVYIANGFTNKSIFKSNKKDGNLHVEYEGKLSSEGETSKANWKYQIDDYFFISAYNSYVSIKTTEDGSRTVKDETNLTVKYSCNVDKPNLNDFELN